MKFSILIAALLCVIPDISSNEDVYREELERTFGEEGFMICTCNGRIVRKELPKNILDEIHDGTWTFVNQYCRRNDGGFCKVFRKCHRCTMKLKMCSREVNNKNRCESSTFTLLDHRRPREAETCPYPPRMETSSIKCRTNKFSRICKQKCLFGHTLPEGITREIRCILSENTWNPKGFDVCKPFVDCTVTLRTGGTEVCSTGTDVIAPVCTISCLRYEDKPPVSSSNYTCTIDGEWNPELPHCVAAGSGLDLARVPKVKYHALDEHWSRKDGQNHRFRRATV